MQSSKQERMFALLELKDPTQDVSSFCKEHNIGSACFYYGFWKEWFFTTWKLDQAVTGVTYIDGDPAKGALITIENKGQMILPVIAAITQRNGRTETLQLPVYYRYEPGK